MKLQITTDFPFTLFFAVLMFIISFIKDKDIAYWQLLIPVVIVLALELFFLWILRKHGNG